MYLRVGIYPLYPRGSNHYFKHNIKGRESSTPCDWGIMTYSLRMLHRFDLLVPSRASGQRHVVPCFRWSRRGGDDEGVDEGGNENWIPSPPEDSRKKDQPLNTGTMKNPRRKNVFCCPEDTCKFLDGHGKTLKILLSPVDSKWPFDSPFLEVTHPPWN